MDEILLNLKDISRERRQENILKVMQHNDLVISLNSKRISILKDETEIPDNNYEEQAKILMPDQFRGKSRSSSKLLQLLAINFKRSKL